MAKETVTAQLSDAPNSAVSVEYDFGDNLAASAKMFGEDVVHSRFRSAAVIDLQSLIRRHIKAGKKPAEIQEAAKNWKPEKRAPAKAPTVESVLNNVNKMSAEERKALLKQLQA